MSTRHPGYRFSNHVPPTSAFFSMTVKGMPARFSWSAALRPPSPPPMTMTLNASSCSCGGGVVPLEPAGPGIQGELFEVEAHVLVGELEVVRQAQARRKALLGADRDLASSPVAVGLQELGALAPQERRVVVATRRRGPRADDADARSRHLVVAGELVQQPAQHQEVGVGDGIFDDVIGRGEQLLAYVRFQPSRRHSAPPRSAPQVRTTLRRVSPSARRAARSTLRRLPTPRWGSLPGCDRFRRAPSRSVRCAPPVDQGSTRSPKNAIELRTRPRGSMARKSRPATATVASGAFTVHEKRTTSWWVSRALVRLRLWSGIWVRSAPIAAAIASGPVASMSGSTRRASSVKTWRARDGASGVVGLVPDGEVGLDGGGEIGCGVGLGGGHGHTVRLAERATPFPPR